MDILKKIEQDLKDKVNGNLKTTVDQISSTYSYLTVFDEENNEYKNGSIQEINQNFAGYVLLKVRKRWAKKIVMLSLVGAR